MSNARRQYNFKVVLLGEGCVGKTSIVLQYVEGQYNSEHITTIQASFLNKKLQLPTGDEVLLNIWDTAGQERFHALSPIYYRGSQGAILVYDITEADSFQKVKKWVRELKRMLGSDIILIIAGNKCDLSEERTVTEQEAVEYAHSVGAHYIETSAKINVNIDKLFEELSRLMTDYAVQHNQMQHSTFNQRTALNGQGSVYGRPRLILADDVYSNDSNSPQMHEPSRSCCG